MKKNIILWSGGKDSTATVILAHLKSIPVDEVVFTEVYYDKQRGISGELPEHIQFIKKVAKPLFESWGFVVTIISADTDYLTHFNRIIEHPRVHADHKGKTFGFPLGKMCAIRRDCKIKPAALYLNKKYGKDGYQQYVGICADEERRLESLRKAGNISLLAEYGFTQLDANALCKSYGLLSPCYTYSKRGGCWMCPFARPLEHVQVKELYPQIWEEFVSLESRTDLANSRWNPFGSTLKERDIQMNHHVLPKVSHQGKNIRKESAGFPPIRGIDPA